MSLSFTNLHPYHATAAIGSIPRGMAFALCAGATVFAAMLWLPVVLVDPDMLWHIVVGNWILANHAIPTVDIYSFTAAGRPWVAHEWLSEVILADCL